ncbi:118aa long hypothetical protein [Pyrococcus horikoshii OT3]|uniref:Uncharacterized protein n=1 Tax=Pyrococcus horikoshii (strain ATCC 700860 / DSM 12428 / JCM 9974 / NBRC 100139 / OT-3) TaxID=70601 RepID=O58929_PYRHO|nr:118aa long hypothetical protein [Pyrococcus horikoshii OT3]
MRGLIMYKLFSLVVFVRVTVKLTTPLGGISRGSKSTILSPGTLKLTFTISTASSKGFEIVYISLGTNELEPTKASTYAGIVNVFSSEASKMLNSIIPIGIFFVMLFLQITTYVLFMIQ